MDSYNPKEDGGRFCGWKYQYFEVARNLKVIQATNIFIGYENCNPSANDKRRSYASAFYDSFK